MLLQALLLCATVVHQALGKGCDREPEANLVENHSWVEDVFWVKELLQSPHDVIGLCAPFHLNIGRDITACAMLSLQTQQIQRLVNRSIGILGLRPG